MTTSAPKLKLARPLYGPSHPKGPSRGPDVVAVKRATARAFPDIYYWADFDPIYNARLERAWRRIQADQHLAPFSGQYGTLSHGLLRNQRRFSHPKDWAFDAIAINLMETKWEAIHSPPLTPGERVRTAMADYMRESIRFAHLWSYRQERPMRNLGLAPNRPQRSDCSSGATAIYFWARQVTGIMVPDPNGRGFDGFGNTATLWSANSSRRASGNYEIGDMALYWARGGHVTVCMAPGDAASSVWWSNGSQRAPNDATLYYRSDLRGVVRPRISP